MTTIAITAVASQYTSAKAAPRPASPMPAGSASAQLSTGSTTHISVSVLAASPWRPPPRSTDASVLVSQIGSAPAPNSHQQ